MLVRRQPIVRNQQGGDDLLLLAEELPVECQVVDVALFRRNGRINRRRYYDRPRRLL